MNANWPVLLLALLQRVAMPQETPQLVTIATIARILGIDPRTAKRRAAAIPMQPDAYLSETLGSAPLWSIERLSAFKAMITRPSDRVAQLRSLAQI